MKFFNENKFALVISLSIYICFFTLGIVAERFVQAPNDDLAKYAIASRGDISALQYIKHNLWATVPLYISFLIFGFLGIFWLAVDGLFFGAVISLAFVQLGPARVLLSLVPHGIFELPATIIAGAAGFKSLEILIRHLRGGSFITKKDLCEFFKLVIISVLLIIIAGIIEATVTPFFINSTFAVTNY